MRNSLAIIFTLAAVFASSAQDFPYTNQAEPARSIFEISGPKSHVPIPYTVDLKEWTTQDGITFSSHFAFPSAWLNRQVILRISEAECAYSVSLNGQGAGICQTASLPTEFNLTKMCSTGRNEITVTLEHSAPTSILSTAKIKGVGKAAVICQPTIRVRDVIISTRLNEGGEGLPQVGAVVKCDALGKKRTELAFFLSSGTEVLGRAQSSVELELKGEDTVHCSFRVPARYLWSPETPVLLDLAIESRIESRVAESIRASVGLRTLKVEDGKLFLNGTERDLHLIDYTEGDDLKNARKNGHNGIVLDIDSASEDILCQCDREGILVAVRAPLDTSAYDSREQRRLSPANLPEFIPSIEERELNTFYLSHRHPCVVGYILGVGQSAGYGLYEAYMKLVIKDPDMAFMHDGFRNVWAEKTVPYR